MGVGVEFEFNSVELRALHPGRLDPAIAKAMRKAGSTATRDMRSEASKRVRRRKRIKAKAVRQALVVRKAKGRRLEGQEWAIDVRGDTVRLADYPARQTKRGVSVEVNRGKRTLLRSAFMATMRSGHRGVFIRRGPRRLPIRELVASRPVDALLHAGEAEGVASRGRDSFARTLDRVLPLELEKVRGR